MSLPDSDQNPIATPHRANTSRREFIRGSLALGLATGFLVDSFSDTRVEGITPNGQAFGRAKAKTLGPSLTLSNKAIGATWNVSDGRLQWLTLTDRISGRSLTTARNFFSLLLKDGTRIESSAMTIAAAPRAERIRPLPNSSRLAERLGGWRLSARLESDDGRAGVDWRAELRDGSNYIRQELFVRAIKSDLHIGEVKLIELELEGARVSGTVKGSPIVSGEMFFGFEHPLSVGKVEGDLVSCSLMRELPLRPGQRLECSSVVGVARPGQLRRDFLNYVERERARPFRPFLHYNSWYDLGYFTKFGEAGALNVIETYGTELVRKRGVVLSSFLFDDGWDDPTTLWRFHSGFPRGFSPLRDAAAKYKTGPGVWMSPWGGYGKPKQERIKFGKEAGFETNEGGFALSGPVYYARFRETCLDMIRKFGVNQFKFDGTGNANRVIPGSEFGSDFEAAINLISELRREKPDLYVNLTTGTYPSPFWLRYADSIWRGGEDHSFAGVGTKRQQWITYRDADTYKNVVKRGPLFPLNALMLHGLIYAKHAKSLDTDPQDDFRSEIRSYFGTGTQLQEMYVTPSLLTAKHWDALAEAANWSRRNAHILVDTHWIGGDPAKLEVYGWASWSPRKGILVLRNPSDKPQLFGIELSEAFELPDGAAGRFSLASPWIEDRGKPSRSVRANETTSFSLAPFQVLTLDATRNR